MAHTCSNTLTTDTQHSSLSSLHTIYFHPGREDEEMCCASMQLRQSMTCQFGFVGVMFTGLKNQWDIESELNQTPTVPHPLNVGALSMIPRVIMVLRGSQILCGIGWEGCRTRSLQCGLFLGPLGSICLWPPMY